MYAVVVKCRRTGWIEIACVTRKTGKEVASAFQKIWIAQKGFPKFFRSDNGTEFNELRATLSRNGVVCNATAAYTPQQNAANERSHGVLLHHLRSALKDLDVGLNFEVMKILVENYLPYVYNMTPTIGNQWKSPMEMAKKEKRSPSERYAPGDKVFYKLEKRKGNKLGDAFDQGRFLSFDAFNLEKSYVLTKTSKVVSIQTRELKVDETEEDVRAPSVEKDADDDVSQSKLTESEKETEVETKSESEVSTDSKAEEESESSENEMSKVRRLPLTQIPATCQKEMKRQMKKRARRVMKSQ